MKEQQKSLQKFTESKTKINNLLSLKRQIAINDIRGLNTKELGLLIDAMKEKLNELDGVERDSFIYKIEVLLEDDCKNQLWEYNHNQITYAISTLIQESNRMPSKNEIALKAELSRQTVHKHLQEYLSHPLYLQHIEQFRFLTSKVLAKVFHFAVNGNMKAARLYFDVMGNLNGQLTNKTSIQNQNNYIQINGVILNQEVVKRLNTEQLNTIETILKTALLEVDNIGSKSGKSEL